LATVTTDAIPPPCDQYTIDLTTALRLAEVENPLIAAARQRISEALAVQQGARALLVPSLNAGTNYHGHGGNLQRSSGRILSLSEQALYFGGGARTLAAESVAIPAVNITSPLTDAIFEPLAARQLVTASRFNARAATNDILLEVAEFYFELVAAEAILYVRRETVTQGSEVTRLTRAYAEAQQGRWADAERAATELSLLGREVRQAEEEVAVSAARLARRLHLDQSVRIRPDSPGLAPLTLIDPAMPLPDLIQVALRVRPELGARAADIAAAEAHHRQECYRPFLPTVWLGFSGGAFGGGSNLVTNDMGHFGGRTDFDARVYWTIQNLGAGNVALAKERWAQVGEAVGERSRTIARVRSEVTAAHAQVAAAREQLDVALRRLRSAEAGFQEDVERIRNTVGRPIEVVNSLTLLKDARAAQIRTVTEYNKAQFRLFVSLGSPPPLGQPANRPLPPAPIAAPPLPPLADGSHTMPPARASVSAGTTASVTAATVH
jgi:outer membrane protein TolC